MKVLLMNPNKWGRGITHIWIPSHASILKSRGHEVELFDCTFYKDWTVNEVAYNTANQQYKPTNYFDYVTYHTGILDDLKQKLKVYQPDIVFWSAISSHIHGEGEYVNIQYGYELLKAAGSKNWILITGGLQATADPTLVLQKMPEIDYLIQGESELVLADFADNFESIGPRNQLFGLSYRNPEGDVQINPPQPIIHDLDVIPPYDYSVFSEQTLFRPYNGEIIKAIDYELSRGCVYSCKYCVETVIQSYYGFQETNSRGTIKNARKYLRNKSAERIFREMMSLHQDLGIQLFRCQDTNFLTILPQTLNTLAALMDEEDPDFFLYIETRPEGINHSSVNLLKRLHVDGVGMGVELSEQSFREDKLRRFADQSSIINAFRLLRQVGIKRTAYNIIGVPDQTEASVIETIKFNQLLDPDNITVAFYSPYLGTSQQKTSQELGYFDEYELDVDGQIRTLSRHSLLTPQLLEFYKANFTALVRNGLSDLEVRKREHGILK